MILRFFLFIFFCLPLLLTAQQHQGDWDAYLTEINKKPVSVIVDLALGKKAPYPERPFVVIMRAKLRYPDANGLPDTHEIPVLDEMEDELVEQLGRNNGAWYAGRFTQRGLREFYFYSLDTMQYLAAVKKAMTAYKEYQWLCQAKEDKTWTNYYTVLYPSPIDMERIQNRRLIDILKKQGDSLVRERTVDHFILFKTKISRAEFVRKAGIDAFKVVESPEDPAKGDFPYLLHIQKEDLPDYSYIERVIIPLWELARKHQGRYDGWETFLVK